MPTQQRRSLLLVAATAGECEPLRQQLDLRAVGPGRWLFENDEYFITLLLGGVGMVNTAWHLGQHMAGASPDWAVNFGIAGSFERSLALGQVVEIREDIFSELGAASPNGPLDLQAMGFPLFERGGEPTYNQLNNPYPSLGRWPAVRGLTVNHVHGTQPEIDATRARWQPQVESMEGAAFFYAMLQAGVPFHALRSISNYVEPRNRAAWRIGPAIKAVNQAVLDLVHAWIQAG
jgi:futalosine hydrolase